MKNDPERYARLSVPFETHEQCIEAVEAFNAELEALREKYRIANVVALLCTFHATDNDDSVPGMSILKWGASHVHQAMIGHAYGVEKAEATKDLESAAASGFVSAKGSK